MFPASKRREKVIIIKADPDLLDAIRSLAPVSSTDQDLLNSVLQSTISFVNRLKAVSTWPPPQKGE